MGRKKGGKNKKLGIPTREEINRIYTLMQEEAELLILMEDYRAKNRLEFFDKDPNPGPNPKQARILNAWTDPFFKTFGMSGGNRLGKTTLLTIIGLSTMFGKYLWDDTSLLNLYPHNYPRKVRYVGQGWTDHIKAVVIPELYKWWPGARKVKRHGNGVITDTFWEDVETGSTLEIMSNNQQSKEHEGWEGDLILYDEPCRRDIYVANARGLVDRNGREMFAATLLEEPWIDREIIKRVDPKTGKPDRRVFWIEGESYDNVGYGITKEGIDEFSSKLSDTEREARIKGIPSYKSGLIYKDFSRKYKQDGGHLTERFKIPLDWMVDIAIDVHPRKQQAVLFTATDQRNEKYLCNEIWEHGPGDWLADEIIRVITYNAYRVNKIIIDPLAKGDANNPSTVFETIEAILLRYGYVLETATKDKAAGILEVKNHLKGPNGSPSIWVFDDLIRTIYEFEGWMWDKETQNPAKVDDDMMENLYRTCLLKTEYEPPFVYDSEFMDEETASCSGRDRTTGY